MKVQDLISLDLKQMRAFAKTCPLAKEEVRKTTDVVRNKQRNAFALELRGRADELYNEARSRGLLRKFEHGVDDFRLEMAILTAIEHLSPAQASSRHRDDPDAILLQRLLGLLPRYEKKSGKHLHVDNQNGVVTLTIFTGKNEYCFRFPLSFFEC